MALAQLDTVQNSNKQNCVDWTETLIEEFNSLIQAATRVNERLLRTNTHTHTLTRCRYQKGKTNLDFTEARDSEWQWHQLGHMQVCTSLQTDNHASTPPLSFFTGRMPFLPPNQQRQSTEGITADEHSRVYATDGQTQSECRQVDETCGRAR